MNRWMIAAVFLLPTLHAPRADAVEQWEVTVTDVLTGVIPLGAFWYTHNIDDRDGRDQYMWSMGTSLFVITSARLAFNEHEYGTRPNGHPYGFPSGHIAFLGSGAAFIQDRYGWEAGIPAWAATAYTAYVRVEDGHHRWRDVIVAGLFTAAASQYFVRPYPQVRVLPFSSRHRHTEVGGAATEGTVQGSGEGDDVTGLQVEYKFQ